MRDATIYLVDDNAEFRQSIAWWLGAEGYDVHAFSGPEEALVQLTASPPPRVNACLLLDVRMPGMSGPDFHSRLIEHGVTGGGRGLPVIYMTGHGDVPLAVEAMQKGAVTFLEKPLQHEALACALERALTPVQVGAASTPAEASEDEGTHHTVGLETPSDQEADPPAQAYRQRFASLTSRERQVLEGLLNGETNKQIARRIGISHKTVELHRARLMSKFQARNLTHLVLMVTSRRLGDCEAESGAGGAGVTGETCAASLGTQVSAPIYASA